MSAFLTHIVSTLRSWLQRLGPRPPGARAPASLRPDERDTSRVTSEAAEPPDPVQTPPPAAPLMGRPQEARPEHPARRHIREQFEAWLDEALTEEDPPAGLSTDLLARLEDEAGTGGPETNGTDLYSLWSAMIALSQETRLQGRAFKQLSETLAPTTELVRSVEPMLEAHRQSLQAARQIAEDARAVREDRDRQMSRQAAREAQEATLAVLLDVRDRLVRGIESARDTLNRGKSAPGPLARLLFGKAMADAKNCRGTARSLVAGCALALQRLDDHLERLEVRPIDCLGRSFDPQTMTAVDIEETSDVPEGTVLEVYRRGYLWGQQVYRSAQVKVARRAIASSAGGEPRRIEETTND